MGFGSEEVIEESRWFGELGVELKSEESHSGVQKSLQCRGNRVQFRSNCLGCSINANLFSSKCACSHSCVICDFKDSPQHSLGAFFFFFWLIGSLRPNEKISGRSSQASRQGILGTLTPCKVIEVPVQEETERQSHVSISCLCRV